MHELTCDPGCACLIRADQLRQAPFLDLRAATVERDQVEQQRVGRGMLVQQLCEPITRDVAAI